MNGYTEQEIEIVKTRITNLYKERSNLIAEGFDLKKSNNEFDVRRLNLKVETIKLIEDTLASSWGELRQDGWCECQTLGVPFTDLDPVTGHRGDSGYMCDECFKLLEITS